MEKGFEVDFSEIINEEDDSCAFADSNILESERQVLEIQKNNTNKNEQKTELKPIKENHDENKLQHKTQINIEGGQKHDLDQHEKPSKRCHHSTIQPVFDCIYCSK